MLSRVNLESFNPRILIKDVLKYTLEKAFDDIKKGRFPAESLSKHFGSMRLSAMLKKEIEAQDPQNYDRRQILIDLWTDSDQICDLSSEIHTAFNLRSLGINICKSENNRIAQNQIKPIYQVTKLKTELSQETASSYIIEPEAIGDNLISKSYELLAKKLKILDDWNNQAMLAQDISQELRVYIFAAIENKIEWDTEMLLKGYFVGGGGKVFQRTNIVFHSPKKTNPSISGVILSLPLNPDDTKDFRDSAIAFQALLQYNYYKNWKFPDGDRYFRIYIRELEKWSQYVLEGIRCYPRKSGEAWNPAPAAVELLAISATMAGHPTNSLEDVINALFLELENNDDENRASSWKQLLKYLKKYHNELLEIVQSRIACTKGVSTKFQIIDTIQIIESLEQIRKSWQPQCEIPEDIRDNKFFKDIYKVRQQVDELLEKAIQEEYERQLDIYQRLISELGEDIKKKDVIDALKAAMEAAQDAAIFRGKKGFEGMTTVLDQFRRTAINPYRETMKRVQTEKENPENNIGKLLQYLSEDYQKVITDSSEFLDNTNNFLDASILEAKSRIAELEKSGGATVESSYQEICEGLANLRNLMNEIKGDTKCS